ncbi:hypothetical protein V1523DRAFT_268868 [Lipomyces doorenjongii]
MANEVVKSHQGVGKESPSSRLYPCLRVYRRDSVPDWSAPYGSSLRMVDMVNSERLCTVTSIMSRTVVTTGNDFNPEHLVVESRQANRRRQACNGHTRR